MWLNSSNEDANAFSIHKSERTVPRELSLSIKYGYQAYFNRSKILMLQSNCLYHYIVYLDRWFYNDSPYT